MAVILNGADLHLVGSVGFDWFEDYFTHAQVLMALAEVGHATDLTIHLNSPGGFTDQGEGIANAIRARIGKTTVVVTGVAMSSATIIACAADQVVMCTGAIYMIHEPSVSLSYANSDGLASAAQAQKLTTDVYAATYVAKTGKSEAEIRGWMKAETYFDADGAIEAGFADRKSADVVDITEAAPAFPYADTKVFAHAPAELVARARKENWTLHASRQPRPPAPAPTGQTQEHPMTDKERADRLAAELETLRATAKADKDRADALGAEKEDRDRQDAILALPEAEGRTEMAKVLANTKGMTADGAKAILLTAAKSDEGDPTPTYEERRLNGEGLNGGGSRTTARGGQGFSLAAQMRKRFKKENA